MTSLCLCGLVFFLGFLVGGISHERCEHIAAEKHHAGKFVVNPVSHDSEFKWNDELSVITFHD